MADCPHPFATMFSLPPDIVFGTITLWYSSIGSIPPGWSLCDGTNETPDLRDSFIQGAGFSVSPGDTGGAATHKHTISEDQDFLTDGVDIADSYPASPGFATEQEPHDHTGETGIGQNRPSYKAYVYIMYTGS